MAIPLDMRPTDEQFRLLIESVKDYAIYFVDEEGIVRSWNAGAERLKGWKADEIIGRSFTTFYTPEAVAAGIPQHNLRLAREEGRVEDVGWRLRKDGTRFWASVVLTAVRDAAGRLIGYAKVTRDLSDTSYRAFVEATNAIVWNTDADGLPITDSPTWRAYTGQTREEWLGRRAWDPLHPDDLPRMQLEWPAAKREKRRFEAEFRLRRHDGVYLWMAARAIPLRGLDGEVREWFGVTYDIHAQKQAEIALERARELWRTTLTSIGDAVVSTDKHGRVTFMNPVAERLMGRRLADTQNRPLNDVFRIVNEETRVAVESPVEKVLEQGVVVGLANHTVLLRDDGSEIPIDDSAAPIRGQDGELEGVVLVFRDVSHEKTSEARRRFIQNASEELMRTASYRDALAAVPKLAVPRLADWCAVEIREPGMAAAEQIAVAHVDAAKLAFVKSLQERYPPDPNAKTGVPEVLRTGQSLIMPVVPRELLDAGAVDEEHRRLIHELKLHSAIVVPLWASDRVIGAITFVHAESGREYNPDDLAFAEDFARRVGLVIERRKAEAEALAANRSKDEFLATMSHELRTPLQAILGWGTMLQRGSARDPQKAIDAIVRNAAAQARLIGDVLDVSRIMSGKLRLSLSKVSVEAVVQAAVDAVRPAAQARRIQLRVDVAADTGHIEADPDRLQQIVWNLVSNAVKFTPGGGSVDVVAARVGSSVSIEVKDTGRGIEPGHLSTIFERFRQIDQSPTREHGGLGLGLAIVRYLVEAHGGQVEAKSAGLGEGATFTVALPAPSMPALTGGSPNAVSSGDGALRGVSVLVVDDDADTRELVGEVLAQAGARVLRASSAAEALEVFATEPPHVVVSDIGMPHEDGFTLLRRIRALPPEKGGDVPAIALTAYARPDDVKRAEAASFQLHVKKPVDPENLVVAVRSVSVADPRLVRPS